MADPDRESEEPLSDEESTAAVAAQPARGLLDDVDLVDLREQPWSWPFHSLLRRLERRHPEFAAFGAAERLAQELPIRFGQDPSLSFPPAEIASWRPPAELPARVGQLFYGLFGPNGALPIHLTDFAVRRRLHHHDPTFARFADLFHHRLLSLLHRAWARARPVFAADRLPEDPYRGWIAALFGQLGEEFAGRDRVPDLDKLFFAGPLSGQSHPPEAVEGLVGEYFDCQVHVREFVGEWIEVPRDSRLRLGGSSRLGLDSTLGQRFWSAQHKFRIEVGPLRYEAFSRMLPDGDDWPVLCDLIRNAVGLEIDWDVNPVLHRDDVPALCLGSRRKLGWTTILPGRTADHFRSVVLDPSLHPVPPRTTPTPDAHPRAPTT